MTARTAADGTASVFPWLPFGTALAAGAASGRRLAGGARWQVCAAGEDGRAALLLRADPDAAPSWWAEEVAALGRAVALMPIPGEATLLHLVVAAPARPLPLDALALRNPPLDGRDLAGLTDALAGLCQRRPEAAWSSALFLPGIPFALATEQQEEDRRTILLAVLSGGARDAALTPERAVRLNPRLDAGAVADALRRLGLDKPEPPSRPVSSHPVPSRPTPAPDGFTLPGHPALQVLLREQVLDVLHRPAEYARMGVPPPGGILFAGPPGCGKSFAAARLAHFLGWPTRELRVSDVGTALLHETSRRLVQTVDALAREAPAVLLLEELDALAPPRTGGHPGTAEEVNTLLRLVEAAPSRGILVLATTNRPEAIDPALRRRGRFDHVITMDYPDEAGAAAMLGFLLRDRPHAEGLDLSGPARRLARRPASDLVHAVNEAARLAVRTGKPAIDDLLLAQALRSLASPGQPAG